MLLCDVEPGMIFTAEILGHQTPFLRLDELKNNGIAVIPLGTWKTGSLPATSEVNVIGPVTVQK